MLRSNRPCQRVRQRVAKKSHRCQSRWVVPEKTPKKALSDRHCLRVLPQQYVRKRRPRTVNKLQQKRLASQQPKKQTRVTSSTTKTLTSTSSEQASAPWLCTSRRSISPSTNSGRRRKKRLRLFRPLSNSSTLNLKHCSPPSQTKPSLSWWSL